MQAAAGLQKNKTSDDLASNLQRLKLTNDDAAAVPRG